MVEREASERACVDGKTRLQCEEANGSKKWRLVDAADPRPDDGVTCPALSVPWRQRAYCDGISPDTCYVTSMFGENEQPVAVCLQPIDEKQPTRYPTWSGTQSMYEAAPISFDRPVARAEMEEAFEPCVVHKFGDASNTAVVGYTSKGDRKACSMMLQNATQVCERVSTHEECKTLVHPVHSDPGESEGCTIRPHDVPIAHPHDGREWFRWHRDTSYSCKAPGWSCKAEDMKGYKPPSCERNEDCNAPLEVGVCDMQSHTCATGSAAGKNCSKHEDCDLLSRVEGVCNAGKCTAGNTGVDAVYAVPKPCNHVSEDSLYTYCGETITSNGDTLFTGVCTDYSHEGREYRGCKAFKDYKEIERIRTFEHDWQAHHRSNHNFYSRSPPWELLDTCPPDKRTTVNGRSVCETTTERIPIRSSEKTCDRVLPVVR